MNVKILSFLALGAVMLTGCGSTGKSNKAPLTNQTMDIIVTEKLEWRNDKSFALNIAEFGKNAELGFGLRDYADIDNNNLSGKDTNSVLSFYIGYLGGGV